MDDIVFTQPKRRPVGSGGSRLQIMGIARTGVIMKRFVAVVTVAVALISLIDCPAFAQATSDVPNTIGQGTPGAGNPNVQPRYTEWKYQALHERLKKRGLLEEMSEFLAPLRLKRKLTFQTSTCGTINAFYDHQTDTVHLCYELIEWIENVAAVPRDKLKQDPRPDAPRRGLFPGVTRPEAVIGAIVGVALHEAGHAIFDIQEIPRLGREEDAADMIAGFVMLQFGVDVAHVMVKGMFNMTYNWFAESPSVTTASVADTHSLSLQRGLAFLCLAYGSDPGAFQDLAGLLPEGRRAGCAGEYRQARNAFRKTVLPDVDQDLLNKVRQMQILRPGDDSL